MLLGSQQVDISEHDLAPSIAVDGAGPDAAYSSKLDTESIPLNLGPLRVRLSNILIFLSYEMAWTQENRSSEVPY